MKFKLHNKVEIVIKNKTYTFFNTMLNSVFEPLKNLKSYFSHIAIGTGNNFNTTTTNKLINHLTAIPANTDEIQNNILNGTLYIKKSIIITNNIVQNKHITEVAITNSTENNPTIFNYISLISDDFPIGIKPAINEEILLTFYIYLNVSNSSLGTFTAGDNEFISFLLGEGLNDKIYVYKSNNLCENDIIYRTNRESEIKHECVLTFENNDTGLNLKFSADLQKGKVYEIVYTIGDKPFARLNVRNSVVAIREHSSYMPKDNYVLDLVEDAKSVAFLADDVTNEEETNYFFNNYANDFGSRIDIPFYNSFNNETPRFLSKDGNKIFFVIDDHLFGYLNSNYTLIKLNCGQILPNELSNIIAFEKLLFITSNNVPYIECYHLNDNNVYEKINLDTSWNNNENILETLWNIDITISTSNIVMLGIISKNSDFGHCVFYNYNQQNASLSFSSIKNYQEPFSKVIAMYKNNFADARVMFLQKGESPQNGKIVSYFSDKTLKITQSDLCNQFFDNAKDIYFNNRGVVIERTIAPKLRLFYFPQEFEYSIPLISNEDENYISTDLLYLIQKHGDSYKIYSLVGYNEPKEFKNGFPTFIDQTKILDFEFLDDILLIFMNDETTPVVALSLFKTAGLIENVSKLNTFYRAILYRYQIPGEYNEGVIANFEAIITLWFFHKTYTHFQKEQMQICQKITTILLCFYMEI